MFKFGLKLWSNNTNYIKEAEHLYEQGIYQFIELYVLPGINSMQTSLWKNTNIPYIIHAPHFRDGLNLAKKELKEINDLRILIENKPYYALDDGLICNGATIEEVKFILGNTCAGLCLDIGHAFCAANAKNISTIEYLKQFLVLNPKMFHLTDGEKDGVFDKHYNFGKGNYNIKEII